MDSMAQATLEIEAAGRTHAVIDTIESTLGIKIGPIEITEAALSLSAEEKIKLAATLWESAMPPMTEPTAGVYVLTAAEHDMILGALNGYAHGGGLETLLSLRNLIKRLEAGDQF